MWPVGHAGQTDGPRFHIKEQPANLVEAIYAARVAQSLAVPIETEGIASAVKTMIEEQMKLVKEELAALTINTAAPKHINCVPIYKSNGLIRLFLCFSSLDVLHSLKIIPRDHIPLFSAANLTAEYEGQTKKRTADAVTNALGGVFFLNEAYALIKSAEKGFDVQALDKLVQQMDLPYTPHMIFAGYKKNMKGFKKLIIGSIWTPLDHLSVNKNTLLNMILQNFVKI